MDILREYYLPTSGPALQARADLPPLAPPKVPNRAQVLPPYMGSARGSAIGDSTTNFTNLVLSDHVRYEGTMNQVVKKLVLSSPDLSHAVETKIKTALSDQFTAIAYDQTGRVDPLATEIVQSFLQRVNLSSHDYTKYTTSKDLRSLTSSLLLDSSRYGAMALELVLGTTRLPAYMQAIPTRLIKWSEGATEKYPVYEGKNGTVELNFPTIFYSATIQDMESAYADSPLATAIQACLWDADFVNDLRRAATKNLLQRLKVVINSEKYMKTLPLEVQTDKSQLQQHMDATTTALETQLSNLNPDDSLVIFDILEAETIADSNRSEDRSISVLQSLINGKVAAGAKILPSIIGRGESSNAASTESLLFLKSVASAQLEVNSLLSRALTLAVRLLGHDAYVKYKAEEVNLRPSLELESFKAIRQSSTLEKLSLGFISDIEASVELTGTLPPQGFKNLSGTMFKYAAANTTGNDYSNTSVSADGKPDSTQAQKDSEAEKKGVKSS